MRQILCASLLVFLFAAPASADTVTYNYIGSPFWGYQDTSCPPVCGITGSVTFDASDLTIPIAYSFTDGNVTVSSENGCFDFFSLGTDIRVFSPCPFPQVPGVFFTGIQINLVSNGDVVTYVQNGNPIGVAHSLGFPGTWTIQPVATPIPEPSTVLLFVTGIGPLFARRKLRPSAGVN